MIFTRTTSKYSRAVENGRGPPRTKTKTVFYWLRASGEDERVLQLFVKQGGKENDNKKKKRQG